MASRDTKKTKICPRIETFCPHTSVKSNKRSCFIMMAYEEEHSPLVERILKSAVRSALGLKPVLAKDVKKIGSTNIFCTKICKEIIESTNCIADITYKNINVGIEYGWAHGFLNKPVIITQYVPKIPKKIRKDEKKTLEKLRKAGAIQYAVLPLNIASDLSGIHSIQYSSKKELKDKLSEGMRIKR